jgi:hypothetical protein
MNVFETTGRAYALAISRGITPVLILALFLWAIGAPAFFKMADAANLTQVSDTLTDSDLGVRSGHTINFTIETALDTAGGSDTIFVDFDPAGDNFQIVNATNTDFVGETGLTVVGTCGVGASEFTLSTTTESFTLTLCSGDTVAADTAISLPIASSTSLITNPGSANSYIVHVETRNTGSAASVLDSADTRVAIIDDVVVTAAVETSLTFQIFGLAAGALVNGVTTSTSTTATAIGFGVLSTAANSSTTAAQRLSVATNAAYGFTVTVQTDQNLTSSTGADIDQFQDGAATAAPIAWTAPANTLGSEDTYGHFGLTSDDDINSSEFGTALFVGNFATTSRAIFHHNGPSDGTTNNIGSTSVAYRIAISALQEAGADYQNVLTYVATPVF